jgi:hypothetical protein
MQLLIRNVHVRSLFGGYSCKDSRQRNSSLSLHTCTKLPGQQDRHTHAKQLKLTLVFLPSKGFWPRRAFLTLLSTSARGKFACGETGGGRSKRLKPFKSPSSFGGVCAYNLHLLVAAAELGQGAWCLGALRDEKPCMLLSRRLSVLSIQCDVLIGLLPCLPLQNKPMR